MLGFHQYPKILWLAFGFMALSTACTPSYGQDWSGLHDEVRESILFIRAVTSNLDGPNERILGEATGFIVTPNGHVITVAHIMPSLKENAEVGYFASSSPNDSRRLRLTFIKSDKNLGVSLFQLPPAPPSQRWKPLTFASSASLPDDVNLLVLGFPLSLELSSTTGILSNRFGLNGRFQTNIRLNPGNSGGPVFDISRHVIGVAWGGIDQAVGITYIIPSELLTGFVSDIGLTIPVDVPDGPTALFNRGYAYLGKQHWNAAIKEFSQAIRLDPQYVPALKNRGAAYLGKHEWDLAIEDYNRAIELEPKYAEHFYNRGAAYLARQDYNRAIRDFNDAIRLNFDDKALALYWRGYAKQQMGDRTGGQADMSAARAINTNVGK
jgi:hypothetical protein